MRLAVAGATGNIGTLTAAALSDGHDVVRISRSLGVDLSTGIGLDEALSGVDAVIDVTNAPAATVIIRRRKNSFRRSLSALLRAGASRCFPRRRDFTGNSSHGQSCMRCVQHLRCQFEDFAS